MFVKDPKKKFFFRKRKILKNILKSIIIDSGIVKETERNKVLNRLRRNNSQKNQKSENNEIERRGRPRINKEIVIQTNVFSELWKDMRRKINDSKDSVEAYFKGILDEKQKEIDNLKYEKNILEQENDNLRKINYELENNNKQIFDRMVTIEKKIFEF